MTGQTIALLLFVALVLGGLPGLLLEDTRRAVARRRERALGGYWYDLHTGEWGRSPYIRYGTAIVGAFSKPLPPPPPPRFETYDFERDRLTYMAEERLAMSIIRPTEFKITGSVV